MDDDKTKKSLKYSIYDGISFAVMDGLTSSFITPFAIALNASVGMIAALTYVPQLAGAFIQLLASKIVQTVKDRRKILVFASLMHAVLWIPLLLIPYATPGQKYLLVAYVAAQTMFAQLINPIWNSLMGDIVPKYERGRFFGLRNKFVGATSFIAALAAGFILNHFSPKQPFLGFTILFSVAFVARLLSGAFKAMMENPSPDLVHEEKFSLIDFVKRMDKTNYGHFVIYIVLFKFAVNIAAPFFAVYMIKNLGFSYIQFTAIIAVELIASFITMGMWGRLIDSRGTKFVLYTTGMLTPFIPLLWLVSVNFHYLIAVEIFSGIVWAGFNLSSSNFIFDSVKPENRVRCIAYYKFFEGIAVFTGAFFGGFLATHIPAKFMFSGIAMVFAVSGILRILVSIFLLPTLREARLIELGIGHSFFKKFLTIRPSEGLVFEVIGKYHEPTEEKHKIMQQSRQQPVQKKEKDFYKKNLLSFMDKSISTKKEQPGTGMHEIDHITEEIEKGLRK